MSNKRTKVKNLLAENLPHWPLFEIHPEEFAPGMTPADKIDWMRRARVQRRLETDILLRGNPDNIPVLKKDYPQEVQDGLTPENTCNFCTFSICCRHITVPLEDPTTRRDFEDLLWMISHHGVRLSVDDEGSWSVTFQSTCNNLMPGGGCAIYDERPAVCREFENTGCEFHKDHPRQMDEYAVVAFHTYRDLLAYIKKRLPLWDDPDWDGTVGGYWPDDEDDEDSEQTVFTFKNDEQMREAAAALFAYDVEHSMMDGWGGVEVEVPTEDEKELTVIRNVFRGINLSFEER